MPDPRAHGPENAEFEIRKAYKAVTEGAIPYLWKNRAIAGVDPEDAIAMYKHAFNCFRKGNKLAAERWARASKHLSRAFAAEAKIAYLESRSSELPSLEGALPQNTDVRESSETTADLLQSVENQVPLGQTELPQSMRHYLARAWACLKSIEHLRTEHIQAAYEYGRVLEIMALAYEAESTKKRAA